MDGRASPEGTKTLTAYQRLRKDIITGVLTPIEHLRAAYRLGCTLREALTLLLAMTWMLENSLTAGR